MYFILIAVIAIIGLLASSNLKRKIKKYSKIFLENGITGKDVAEKMLYDNGIYDVRVTVSDGILSDNYNPNEKIIGLSKAIYSESNIFSMAVAAHETGHAIQHATAYTPLVFRSALVPVVNFSAQWVQWIIFTGLLLMGSGSNFGSSILLTGIGLFFIITLFSFITLPVEIDASMRALNWVRRSGITSLQNYNYAEKALRAAAYTYVIAALSSLATLFYYVMIYTNRKN
jgi:Zn-dependent membrane protease YugP